MYTRVTAIKRSYPSFGLAPWAYTKPIRSNEAAWQALNAPTSELSRQAQIGALRQNLLSNQMRKTNQTERSNESPSKQPAEEGCGNRQRNFGAGHSPENGATTTDRRSGSNHSAGSKFLTSSLSAQAQVPPSLTPPTCRTVRRVQLREIVPLAATTIYEMEQRGEFPRRFYLTPRCVVWDLSEVEAWVIARRQASNSETAARAPVPDVRRRRTRPVTR
jgi:prophage regulatory protein